MAALAPAAAPPGPVLPPFSCKKCTDRGETAGAWKRLGGCADLPLVLVGGLSYEPTSDTVVAGTMGRGVYKMTKATQLIRAALAA